MAGEAEVGGDAFNFLEQQIRFGREEQKKAQVEIDMLRRQVYEVSEQLELAERLIRTIEPRFAPFKGVPEKIREVDESTEHIRQAVNSNKAEIDSQLRILRSEADYDREERSDQVRRIDHVASQIGLAVADVAQVQAQTSQLNQVFQTLIERQREVEQKLEQFGLRLDRSIEVHRDMEERVRTAVLSDLDERFEVVFERLQLVGEMVRRSEDLVATVANERSMREELLHEMAMWRDQQARTDGRINVFEEIGDRLAGEYEKLHNSIVLLEGRQTGIGERLNVVRKDISEVVDQVREEFAKFNQLLDKQRRKQIQGLEQELREMKFHAFRPPEEP